MLAFVLNADFGYKGACSVYLLGFCIVDNEINHHHHHHILLDEYTVALHTTV